MEGPGVFDPFPAMESSLLSLTYRVFIGSETIVNFPRPHGAGYKEGWSLRKVELHRIYRHFKGDHYLVEAIATDSETGEPVVIYRKLYGDGGLWVRPLSMFLEPVDREKYPDCPQEYRFELLEVESAAHR